MDGSVQPYGLVIPSPSPLQELVTDLDLPTAMRRCRLDFWFHGRGETLTELDSSMAAKTTKASSRRPTHSSSIFTVATAIGSRFAGETDFFEALDHVKKRYPIDENRMVVRGFRSAARLVRHMATHHASLWAAAAPGAGFSEKRQASEHLCSEQYAANLV